MRSITQIKESLEQVLAEANEVARETGFIRRERNFDGAQFFLLLLFGWLEQADASLDALTQVAQECEVELSAPGLSKRFTGACARFMQAMLERMAAQLMQADPVDIPLLRRFEAVVVEDSSVVGLPPGLQEVWRGCGGRTGTSPAAVKLHVRWDLLCGQLQGPCVSDGRLPDNRSPFKAVALLAGTLFLADLGYFDLDWLKRQAQAGVWWLMRLKSQTVLLNRKGSYRLQLRGLLPQQVGQVVQYGVLVGAQARIPARLIIVRVPSEVAKQRRERLEEEARDKGQAVSPEQWYLAEWTIVITNVSRGRLSVIEVLQLMRIRWQLELLYKLWKQYGQIDEWRSKQPWRILCEVYGKLAAMLLQHWLILLGCWHDPWRSLVKAAQVVRRHAMRVLAALHGEYRWDCLERSLRRSMRSGCRVNRRKADPGTMQMLLEGPDWELFSP